MPSGVREGTFTDANFALKGSRLNYCGHVPQENLALYILALRLNAFPRKARFGGFLRLPATSRRRDFGCR
jgi:hypothetical protein